MWFHLFALHPSYLWIIAKLKFYMVMRLSLSIDWKNEITTNLAIKVYKYKEMFEPFSEICNDPLTFYYTDTIQILPKKF